MYRVCAHYCGTTIGLMDFDNLLQAEKFMEQPYILFYKDEISNGAEDEVIYPYEMWIEEALPFTDPPTTSEWPALEYAADLPF